MFAPFIDSSPRSRRGTFEFVSKPLVRTSGEPMKIQIPAFLISKRGLSASLRLHTGPRLWRQPCQQSRTNSNEETRRPLFLCFIASLLPPLLSTFLSFFLYFEPHDQSFLLPRCAFFPWMHIPRRKGGIIPRYRDLVNDPIRRRNRVLIRIPGLVSYDCLARNTERA